MSQLNAQSLIPSALPTSKRDVAKFTVVVAVLTFGSYWLAALAWDYIQPETYGVFGLLAQWDSGWYLSIITDGYQLEPRTAEAVRGQANWAFFPLYPTIVWVVKTATGFDAIPVAVVLSNTFRAVGAYYSYLYLSTTRDRPVAALGVLLLFFGPYSFYFGSFYTESLFAMLVAAGFYHLHHRRWLLVGVITALLSATRGTGVLFAIPFVITMLADGGASRSIDSIVESVRTILTSPSKIAALVLSPLGILSFMAYLQIHVGDALAFAHIQDAWGRSFGNPLTTFVQAVISGPEEQYMVFCALLGVVLMIYLLAEGRYAEGVFGLLLILVPLASGTNSLPRYVAGTVVVWFAIAELLDRVGEYRWPAIGLLAQANATLLILWFARSPLVN